MFQQGSRYHDVAVATYVDERGAARPWVTPRLATEPAATVAYRVRAHDRIDLLAHRAYGDPGAWWRIADANPAAVSSGPAALVDSPAALIDLPHPVRPEVLS